MAKEVLILDVPGCDSCKYAEELIAKIKKEEKLKIKVKIKDISKNPTILQKYPIMSAPGIVIDGKFFGEGKPSEKKLRAALKK